MFDFLSMADNYPNRKVDRTEINGVLIDTCMVTDGERPYETGVEHPSYNNGRFVIVEAYDNIEDAVAGHKKRVEIMTSKELPDKLVDCLNSCVSGIGAVFGCETEFYKQD